MKESELLCHKTTSENLNIQSIKEVKTQKESILYDFTQVKLKNRQNSDRG